MLMVNCNFDDRDTIVVFRRLRGNMCQYNIAFKLITQNIYTSKLSHNLSGSKPKTKASLNGWFLRSDEDVMSDSLSNKRWGRTKDAKIGDDESKGPLCASIISDGLVLVNLL